MNAYKVQFILQITLFQLQFWCWKLQILIQYRKFPIIVGSNLYGTGSKIEVENPILMFGKRNLDYKLNIARIQFYSWFCFQTTKHFLSYTFEWEFDILNLVEQLNKCKLVFLFTFWNANNLVSILVHIYIWVWVWAWLLVIFTIFAWVYSLKPISKFWMNTEFWVITKINYFLNQLFLWR